MPNLVSGHTGGLRQFHVRETGMPEGCIRKKILHTNIILNITDIPLSLVIKTLYHSGRLRDGIRISLWSFIRRQVQNTLSVWVLIMIISFCGTQSLITGMQLIWVRKRMWLGYGNRLQRNRD